MSWRRLRLGRKRYKRRFFKRTLFFFGVVLLSWGGFWLVSDFLVIKTIKLVGQNGQVPQGIKELEGQSLLFLDQEKWEEKIRKKNPLLKEIEVKKELPDRVLIKFKKRKPLAAIFDPFSKNFFLIDQEGVILKKGREGEEKLPLIIASLQNFKIGDRIENKSSLLALDLISILEERALKARFEIEEARRVLKISLADGVLILVSLDKEKQELVYSLKTLIKKFGIEGNWPKKIDLRFKKPVLTF